MAVPRVSGYTTISPVISSLPLPATAEATENQTMGPSSSRSASVILAAPTPRMSSLPDLSREAVRESLLCLYLPAPNRPVPPLWDNCVLSRIEAP